MKMGTTWTGQPIAAAIGGTLAALLVMTVYWPARENGFVWDDWSVVDAIGASGMHDPALWRETLSAAPGEYAVLFRPVAVFSYLLQFWVGQVDPEPFHIVNLAVHAGNVFLLTLVAWQVLGEAMPQLAPGARSAFAGLCSLVYGLHPALSEPAIWISARPDLLLTSFVCFALLIDRALRESGWSRALGVGACFLLALLCKETAIGFVLALPLLHLAIAWREPGMQGAPALIRILAQEWRVYAALSAALVLYFAARFAVAGARLGIDDSVVSPLRYIHSPGEHALVVAASLARHVWTALWPFQDAVPSRHMPLPVRFEDVLPMAAASASLVILALAALRSSLGRVPALLFLAFFLALLPVANIVPIPAVAVPVEIVVASRYLAFPLVFACLAVPFAIRLANAHLSQHTGYGRVLLVAIVGAWLLASLANIRVTIPLWRDDLVLNTWALRQQGASFWRQGNIGAHYLRLGDHRRARDALAAAVELRDDEHGAWIWNNLGVAEFGLGDIPRAVTAFGRALELDPGAITPRTNLARLARREGDLGRARALLEEGVRRAPRSAALRKERRELHHELGLTYADSAMPGEAMAQLGVALELSRGPQESGEIRAAMRSVPTRK